MQVTELFFYVGAPPPDHGVPDEYRAWNDVGRWSGAPAHPALVAVMEGIEREMARRHLSLDEVFEDAALRANAVATGLHLVIQRTKVARGMAAAAVEIAEAVGVRAYDPLGMGPVEQDGLPDPDDVPPPPPAPASRK